MKLPKINFKNFTTSDYICLGVLGLCGVTLVKNEVTYRQQIKIDDAIYRHNMDVYNEKCAECIEALRETDDPEKIHDILQEFGDTCDEDFISYDEAESYAVTLFKFWDWGHKHIVKKEIYEEIEPYILPYKDCTTVKRMKRKKNRKGD